MSSSSTPQVENLRLGWIGLGSMGLAMAINVQKHLQANSQTSLKYWNRTISKGGPLKALGGEPCESIAELADRCTIIFVSVRT